MLGLVLDHDPDAPLSVLCLGAHSDDIEIGCGGTILQLLDARRNVSVHWVVFGASGARAHEAERSAKHFLRRAASATVFLKQFRDGFFPYMGGAVKEEFENLKGIVTPDLIFTHCRDDRHQDHRLVHELTWNTWRNHLILEYEVPKYDGDFGVPNYFVPLSAAIVRRKIAALARFFPTQSGKHWFDEELFRGVLRLRGMECNAPARYAEAFYARKLTAR